MTQAELRLVRTWIRSEMERTEARVVAYMTSLEEGSYDDETAGNSRFYQGQHEGLRKALNWLDGSS